MLWGHTIHEGLHAGISAHPRLRNASEVVSWADEALRVPPQGVLDATIEQAKITITDGNAPFNQMTWRALLRKLDRDAPDYKT